MDDELLINEFFEFFGDEHIPIFLIFYHLLYNNNNIYDFIFIILYFIYFLNHNIINNNIIISL